MLGRVYIKLLLYGFDAKKFIETIRQKKKRWYSKDFKELKRQKGDDDTFEFGNKYPILTERESAGGTMKGHYFHQDLYIARKIYMANPKKHIDIGSRTDGFVAHVATFRSIEIFDIRNIKSKIKNITFRQADLMQLPDDLINYCDSISSLHVIEHFGLGRYGDPIDYFGHVKAIDNISKILVKNGIFYFSTPIGRQRIEFNAQRVFSVEYLIKLLSDKFRIINFSYIDDYDDFYENAELSEENIKTNFKCNNGCGIFILEKK